MAVLTQKQIKKIKEIINRNFNTFILFTLGADKLAQSDRDELRSLGLFDDRITENLFRDAFKIGKTRPVDNKFLPNEKYRQWKEGVLGMYLSAIDQQSMENIDDSTLHYVENLKEKTENRILTSILDANKNAVLDHIGSPIGSSFERADREAVDIRKLAKELEEVTGDVTRDWKKVVVTELNSAHSQGTIHSIIERKSDDEDTDDIMVYCIGPLDGATSPACRKHYHEGGSYKVYRLTELLENGTNIGKKANSWGAVVPPMHPNCRHRLVELPRGFTLNHEGMVVFIHNNHHDLDNNMAVDIKKSLKGKTPTFSGHKLHKRTTYQGLKISVENRKGSYRHWTDRNGKSGKTKMQYDYGYIRNTLSRADGDHVDCYVGPYPDAENAYVIHQKVEGKFDEDKVMLGFPSRFRAKRAYLKHYNSTSFYGGMTTLKISELKERILGKTVNKIEKGGVSRGGMAANHKYIKRTGGPGNYHYWYKMPDGSLQIKDKDGHIKAGGNPDQAVSHHYNPQIHDNEMRAHPDWEKHAGQFLSRKIKVKPKKRGRPRKPRGELQEPQQVRRTRFDNTRKVIKVSEKTVRTAEPMKQLREEAGFETPKPGPRKPEQVDPSAMKEWDEVRDLQEQRDKGPGIQKPEASSFKITIDQPHSEFLKAEAQEVFNNFINEKNFKPIDLGSFGGKGIVTTDSGKEYFIKSEVGAEYEIDDLDITNNEVAYSNGVLSAYPEMKESFPSKLKVSNNTYIMPALNMEHFGPTFFNDDRRKQMRSELTPEKNLHIVKMGLINSMMSNYDRHGGNCGVTPNNTIVCFDEGLCLNDQEIGGHEIPAYMHLLEGKDKIDYKSLSETFTDERRAKLVNSLLASGIEDRDVEEVAIRFDHLRESVNDYAKNPGSAPNTKEFINTVFKGEGRRERANQLAEKKGDVTEVGRQ